MQSSNTQSYSPIPNAGTSITVPPKRQFIKMVIAIAELFVTAKILFNAFSSINSKSRNTRIGAWFLRNI